MNSYVFENNGSTITIETTDVSSALYMMKGLKADGYTLIKTKIKHNENV